MAGDVLTSRPDRPLSLDGAALKRLEQRVYKAAGRGKGDAILVSATSRVARPASLVNLLRGATVSGQPWALIEQPDRGRRGLLALGTATTLQINPAAPRRLSEIADRWHRLAATALADAPGGIPGSGVTLIGGMAFDAAGGDSAPGTDSAPVTSPSQPSASPASVTTPHSPSPSKSAPATTPAPSSRTHNSPRRCSSRSRPTPPTRSSRPPKCAPCSPPATSPRPSPAPSAASETATSRRSSSPAKIEVRSTQPWDVPDVLHRLATASPPASCSASAATTAR